MKHVDLEKFANGAFSAQVNRAIEEVTENIQNPNTDAGATRKITICRRFFRGIQQRTALGSVPA